MGSTREEQDRVRSLLLDTVTLLCKNGLNFKKQLKVQGLLGITLDEDDVFIVHINEKVGELIVEHHKKDDSDESSIDSTPAKVHRKRRSDSSPMYRGPPDKIRIKTEKEEPSEDDLILIDENQCDDKSKIQKTIIQQQQPGLHSITNFQGGYQPFNQQNNMQTGPGYMTSSNILPHQNMPQTGQPTPEKRLAVIITGMNPYEQQVVTAPRRSSSAPDKQYVCDHPGCGKKYYYPSDLRRHCKKKHDGKSRRQLDEEQMEDMSYDRGMSNENKSTSTDTQTMATRDISNSEGRYNSVGYERISYRENNNRNMQREITKVLTETGSQICEQSSYQEWKPNITSHGSLGLRSVSSEENTPGYESHEKSSQVDFGAQTDFGEEKAISPEYENDQVQDSVAFGTQTDIDIKSEATSFDSPGYDPLPNHENLTFENHGNENNQYELEDIMKDSSQYESFNMEPQ